MVYDNFAGTGHVVVLLIRATFWQNLILKNLDKDDVKKWAKYNLSLMLVTR